MLVMEDSHRQHQKQKKQRDHHRRHDPIGQTKLRQSTLPLRGGSVVCPQSPFDAVEKPVIGGPYARVMGIASAIPQRARHRPSIGQGPVQGISAAPCAREKELAYQAERAHGSSMHQPGAGQRA
jgi:hypothetical protein